MLRTYEEWKDEGFVVMCGEKAICRNKCGICLFSEDQVKEIDDFFMYEEMYYDREQYY